METGGSTGGALLPAIGSSSILIGPFAFLNQEFLAYAVVQVVPRKNLVKVPASVYIEFRDDPAGGKGFAGSSTSVC